ncbi:MAG: GDSL-type esterase/lipase family protein, partial [Roseibacillus sp.]|nr:GDSL-type esterase/lipase family protein [Roseibacillus sp.]
MSLRNAEGGGVALSSAGIGGARYRAVNRAEALEAEVLALQPDVLILDYGTNDYLYTDMLPEDLEEDIREAIGRIRAQSPLTAIVLTTAGDLYRDGLNVRSAKAFGELIYRIAEEEGCPVLDWFWLAGGPRSALQWR